MCTWEMRYNSGAILVSEKRKPGTWKFKLQTITIDKLVQHMFDIMHSHYLHGHTDNYEIFVTYFRALSTIAELVSSPLVWHSRTQMLNIPEQMVVASPLDYKPWSQILQAKRNKIRIPGNTRVLFHSVHGKINWLNFNMLSSDSH